MEQEFNIDPKLIDELAKSIKSEKDLAALSKHIQKHGRWRTTRTVVEYVEAGRQFVDSVVKVLFEY